MNYSEVKELLNVGFSADEIRQMMNPQVINSQNSQDNPQEEQPQQVQQEEQPQPIQQEQNQDDAKFNQLNETMTKILSAIQSANLQNNSFDSINKTDLNSEVDKIMGSIIRPERKEGGFNS